MPTVTIDPFATMIKIEYNDGDSAFLDDNRYPSVVKISII